MKITKFLMVIFLVLPVLTSCAAKNSKEGRPTSQIQAFKSSEGWQKLDGRFKMAWEDAMKKSEVRRKFECLLKTKTKPAKADKRALSDAGFMVRGVIGKIFTGSVAAQDVPQVAALKIVFAMELAVPLSPKRKKI